MNEVGRFRAQPESEQPTDRIPKTVHDIGRAAVSGVGAQPEAPRRFSAPSGIGDSESDMVSVSATPSVEQLAPSDKAWVNELDYGFANPQSETGQADSDQTPPRQQQVFTSAEWQIAKMGEQTHDSDPKNYRRDGMSFNDAYLNKDKH